MDAITIVTPTLKDVFQRLGEGNTSVTDTLKLLKERGVKCSRNSVYQTIHGRSSKREVVEAFLETAEAEFQRRKGVQERISQLAAAE